MADYKSAYTGQEIDAGIGKAMTALQEEQYTGTYSKPSGGIPKTDLASSVQTSLNKADSAYQKANTGIPENDLSDAVKTKLNAGGGSVVSPWNGKIISIMGDSISTYQGYIPVSDGHNLDHVYYYPRTGFNDVDKTWWKALITELGAKLGVNDSWSGSYVGNTSDNDIVTGGNNYGKKVAMASNTRIENLGSNGTPDLILVFGGTNDIWSGYSRVGEIVPGTFDSTVAYDIEPSTLLATYKWDSFAEAYRDMIRKMMYYYPKARIVAMLPFYSDEPNNRYNSKQLNDFVELQKSICNYFGVNYIDLRRCGINIANNNKNKNKDSYCTILTQGVHPNYDGMEVIKNYVKAKLLSFFSTDGQESITYTVTNTLSVNTNADRYIKAVSKNGTYSATITGNSLGIVKVAMGGTDITSTAYNSSNGKITISNVTGNIVITEGAITTYTITTNVTNGTKSGDTQVAQGGTASVTITPSTGYELPSTVTVTGATHSYNSSTGVISLSNPTGNITITAVCEQSSTVTYTITNNLTNVTNTNDSISINENASYSGVLHPAYEYAISNVSITMGGTDITSTAYNSNTNTISIASVTGNVVITANATARNITWYSNYNTAQGSAENEAKASVAGFAPTAQYLTYPENAKVNCVRLFVFTPGTITVGVFNTSTNATRDIQVLDMSSYSKDLSNPIILDIPNEYTLGENERPFIAATTDTGTFGYNETWSDTTTQHKFYTKIGQAGTPTIVNYQNKSLRVDFGYAGTPVTSYSITTNVSDGTSTGDISIQENGTASVIVSADTGYELPDSITVTGATYTYTKATGTIALSEPTGNVTISVVCEESQVTVYTVTTSVTNGTYSGATQIQDGGTASVTIAPSSGYELPSTVSVSGASYTYDDSTGVISLSSPTGNVTISATCPAEAVSYTITNTLSQVTSSNNATSIGENESYSATLTPSTNYTIESVEVKMGGVDITSTVYDSSTGEIDIDEVTGNLVITAMATTYQSWYSGFAVETGNAVDEAKANYSGFTIFRGNNLTPNIPLVEYPENGKVNQVRFFVFKPGTITVGKCKFNIVNGSIPYPNNGSTVEVLSSETLDMSSYSKDLTQPITLTLQNEIILGEDEQMYIGNPSDTGTFGYNASAPSGMTNHGFIMNVRPNVGTGITSTQGNKNLRVDYGYNDSQ